MFRTFTAFCFSFIFAGTALAQAFPEKPARVVVPLSTGSSSDALARFDCSVERKGNGSHGGAYGGHFRAIQGFRFIGVDNVKVQPAR